MASKPYMPLMMGDWLQGTRGMRAEVKGVYIGLLIYQYDNGYLPEDIDTIALIEPEVGKVWVFLEHKFPVVSPGRRQNKKCEEVRAFWNKQAKNGEKGGRPTQTKPKSKPKQNPNNNPKGNHHNDLDLDTDIGIQNQNGVDFSDYQQWTDDIIDGNDYIFWNMATNEKIPRAAHTEHWVRDHLDMIGRYPAMKPPDQQRFRHSCLKHVRDNFKKQPNVNRTNDKANIRRADASIDKPKSFGSFQP